MEKYEEFANKMTNGNFANFNAKEKLQYVFDTEEGMYVPQARLTDYNWLNRNFLIQNKNHPLAAYVMFLVKNILVA